MISSTVIGFYALAAVAVIASLRVVMHPNPVHAILAMIVSLLAVAGIFFIIGAPFAGALEVIVYAGAIMVLFVFVIMMLNLGLYNDHREEQWLSAQTWAVPTGLTIIIAVVLYAMIGLGSGHEHVPAMMGTQTVTIKSVGTALFSQYVLLVQVAALLLLAALVAAYHLGKRALDDENASHSSLLHDELHSDMLLKQVSQGEQDSQGKQGGQSEHPNSQQSYEYRPIDAQAFKKSMAKTNHSRNRSRNRAAQSHGSTLGQTGKEDS